MRLLSRAAALVLCLAATTGCIAAGATCREATEFVPRLCPSGLPAVAALKVEWPRACASFALGPRGARRFFARAWKLDDPRGEGAVERSPCTADGTLRLADGRTAKWRIEQIGTATLVFDATGERLTLLCPECHFAPFPPFTP